MAIYYGSSLISNAYLQSGAVSNIYYGSTPVKTGGGSGPAQFSFPTPSFGSTNLIAWYDTALTFTDQAGNITPSYTTDSLGYNTINQITDLTGAGYNWYQGDKSLQPSKAASGLPAFDVTNAYMTLLRKDMFNGLSQVSMYWKVKPLAGNTKRVFISATQGGTAIPPSSYTIAAGGSGYSVGNILTLTGGAGTQSKLRVTSVDGGGAVTGIQEAFTGGYTTQPTNPSGTTVTPVGGTGCTINVFFTAIKGGGGNVERFTYQVSSGNTTRKMYISHAQVRTDLSPNVENASVQTTSGTPSTTSLGAPNNAILTDTTSFHTVGVEVDFITGAVSYYYDGVLDGTATLATTNPLGNTDSINIYLGNNSAFASPGLIEFKSAVILSEVPNSTRRAQIFGAL